MHKLLMEEASLVGGTGSVVAAGGLQGAGSVAAAHRLTCSTMCGVSLPGPGTELISPALAGRFFTTGPPGKSCN